jgi:LytS/YehU family sensor histidine kinase
MFVTVKHDSQIQKQRRKMKSLLFKIYQKHRFNPIRILWISLGLNLILNILFLYLHFSLDPMTFEPVHQEFYSLLNRIKGWRFILLICYLTSYLAIVIGLVLALIYEIKRRSRLESNLQQAELISLKARIQPHFLFNTLNAIKVLIREEPEKADQMIQLLSELYQYILKASESELTPLSAELEQVERYLMIEKVRFGDRLSYSIEVDPALYQKQIPALVLQPLVENCIKHGTSQKIETGRIEIRSRRQNDKLLLTISDNGSGFSHSRLKNPYFGKGYGLKNVNERWLLFSGQSLAIESTPGTGTTISLDLGQ